MEFNLQKATTYIKHSYKNILKFDILLVLQIISLSVFAQNIGGFPSGVKWYSVENKHVKVIYPDSLKESAQRIANIIEHINQNNLYSVGKKSKKLDLVLQTGQVISNGFVSLAPYKSEFFGVGAQNMMRLGSVNWLDGLSIHEYRHALQFANSRRGFSKFLSFLAGQIGWAGAINLSIPAWYFEGDAVMTETMLSNAGRGRIPFFYKELRANLLSGKNYSYMTARNGSYNKLLPSIYPMGFAICNYTRNNYGDNVWAKILKDAGRYKSVFYPFSRAMKRYTGISSRKMYKNAVAQLKTDWETELSGIKLTPTERVSQPPKRTVTNYKFPQIMNDGTIVAVKNSYEKTNRLVQIKNGKESKLTNYGISQTVYLSANNNRLTWSEYEPDIRRGNVNYNKIVSYDFNTKTKKTVCRKTRYFSPHISSDGNKIVVVNVGELLANNIVIIDAKTGKELKRLPNLNNDFISFPKWTKDDKNIVYIAKRNSKLAIMKMSIDSHETKLLTNWTSNVFGSISLDENYVYFSASFSGIDNIYAVDLNGNKQIKQLSSVKIGAYQPCISSNGNELIMSLFSSMGYELARLNITENIQNYPNISYQEPKDQKRYKIKTNEYEHNILDSVKKLNYEEKPYKGLLKGVKLHSWFFSLSPNSVGFNMLANNTLNDFKGVFGVNYNFNDTTMGYNAKFIYARWFPVLSIATRLGDRNRSNFVFSSFGRIVKEAEVSFGVNIPLTWVKNQYFIKLNTGADIEYSKILDTEYWKAKNSYFASVGVAAKFSILRSKARQNIMPRLGFKLHARWQKSINAFRANKFYANTTVFLPSVFVNHGVKINAAFKYEDQNNDYFFENRFVYSRGYNAEPCDRIYRLSTDYSLPLLYPNWGFGGLTYFKRISANLFLDISRLEIQHENYSMDSMGGELIFDNTIFNVLPIKIGCRASHLLSSNRELSLKNLRYAVFVNINM